MFSFKKGEKMNKLNIIYPVAVDLTKQKINQDIIKYLENKESMPSFEQFLIDRNHYVEQIWVNVWLNKATNDVSKNEKKSFLSGRGIEVEGVDRKLINKLFRIEMRTYQPFNVLVWLNGKFDGNEEKWQQLYEGARSNYLKRQEEVQQEEKRRAVQLEIENNAMRILEENELLFYLQVRLFTARRLIDDLENQPKFKRTDPMELEEKLIQESKFDPSDYVRLADFFEEFTGEIHKTLHWGRTYYEYETYYFPYERLISEYLYEVIPTFIIKNSSDIQKLYQLECNEELTSSVLMRMIFDSINEVAEDYFAALMEEFVVDLIHLGEIPFDAAIHKERFEQDLAAREKRMAEELAENQRKKEEEVRNINDIFGREYSHSFDKKLHYVLHIGETNTGKTHQALSKMKDAESGLYLAPLRLLALEVYDKLNSDGIACSLKTGEEEKNVANARHISCTVEMFHEKDFYEVVVIDEAQMIADKDRGFSWFKAITKANANEVHIIGSRNIKTMMMDLLGDSHIEIHEYRREIPLEVQSKEFHLKNTRKGDALVCFSRRNVLGTASRLQNNGYSVSMIYGSMPPETRKKEMQRFIKGETTVIVSTDAIGMGLNLPIRRIVFLENEKFDGTKRRTLSSQEVKQIAGRAGRKGLYNVGEVAFTTDINRMKRLLQQEDEPELMFAIAPTNSVFERFQKHYHDLGTFFELWEKFKSPIGTKKATLFEERELYELIRDTEIEGRLSMMDLYGFLHLPFSTKEAGLTAQWRDTMFAIVEGKELPEPEIKRRNLEDLELSYKAIGLHLLFLYRLEKRTEAIYWERVREEISDQVHEHLKTEVKNYKKECKRCGKKLPWDFSFPICDACHTIKYRRNYESSYRRR